MATERIATFVKIYKVISGNRTPECPEVSQRQAGRKSRKTVKNIRSCRSFTAVRLSQEQATTSLQS